PRAREVRAFRRGPERTRPAVIVEVLAERLTRSAFRTGNDRVRELQLIFPRYLMHAPSLRVDSTPRGGAAHLSGFERRLNQSRTTPRSRAAPSGAMQGYFWPWLFG